MKISVITPSLNSGKYIERAIESVLEQGYENFEHIIMDGLSTDNTIKILKKYPHLKWVSEKDSGQSNAMNKGFALSTGDIIVYLNADDYFMPAAFEAVIPYFERGEKFVVGDAYLIELNGKKVKVVPKVKHEDILHHWRKEEYIEENVYWTSFPNNPVQYFYLREVQEKFPFNEHNHLTMDVEFLMDASSQYDFCKIDEVLGTYVLYEDAKSIVASNDIEKYWTFENFSYINKFIDDWNQDKKRAFKREQQVGYLKIAISKNNNDTKQQKAIAWRDEALKKKDESLQVKQDEILLFQEQLERKEEVIEEKDKAIAWRDERLKKKDESLQQKEENILHIKEQLEHKSKVIKEKDDAIAWRNQEVKKKDESLLIKHDEVLYIKTQLEHNSKMIEDQIKAIAWRDERLKKKDESLQQKEENILHIKEQLEHKSKVIKEKDDAIAWRDEALKKKDESLQQKEENILHIKEQLEHKSEVIEEKIYANYSHKTKQFDIAISIGHGCNSRYNISRILWLRKHGSENLDKFVLSEQKKNTDDWGSFFFDWSVSPLTGVNLTLRNKFEKNLELENIEIKVDINAPEKQIIVDKYNNFKYPHSIEGTNEGLLTNKMLFDAYPQFKSKMDYLAKKTQKLLLSGKKILFVRGSYATLKDLKEFKSIIETIYDVGEYAILYTPDYETEEDLSRLMGKQYEYEELGKIIFRPVLNTPYPGDFKGWEKALSEIEIALPIHKGLK